jgi:hypothetical protein
VLDPSIVIFDACVLYPFHLRNIVVQIAVDRLVDARDDALPDATVVGYQAHLDAITLPDPDDRHVVAAAITAGASVILTWNLRDFPTRELRKHSLVRQTPDIFLSDLYEKAPDLTVASLANARRNLSKTRVSASDFIDILMNQKLSRLATSVKKHRTDL